MLWSYYQIYSKFKSSCMRFFDVPPQQERFLLCYIHPRTQPSHNVDSLWIAPGLHLLSNQICELLLPFLYIIIDRRISFSLLSQPCNKSFPSVVPLHFIFSDSIFFFISYAYCVQFWRHLSIIRQSHPLGTLRPLSFVFYPWMLLSFANDFFSVSTANSFDFKLNIDWYRN